MAKIIWTIAAKELRSFFTASTAYIFLGTFLLVSFFIFFWVETFFARNLVDVRPLFDWMPITLIFLVAALTMRMWSEERSAGTIDLLIAAPVRTRNVVLGKFLACLSIIVLALLLTVSLPLSVSFMGNLDWGPVLGAYAATLLLAASYLAIGLYISARYDNQITSLIVTTVACGLFYCIGADSIANLFGSSVSQWFEKLGSGARFHSISRGVLDLRDVYYYLSLTGTFLLLNAHAVQRLIWSPQRTARQRAFRLLMALCVANLLCANVWLDQSSELRLDLTENKMYSISEVTQETLAQLQEPLLIRGYFSNKTHPLLAPLVPQIRDMLQEYRVASDGRVQVEFLDPRNDEELELEAQQKYGITPVPFQFADRYQAELVNSYFHIVLAYGDEFEVLSFRELIEMKAAQATDLQVQLRNLEYDITRSIKKVVRAFQNTDNLFAQVTDPIRFVGYVSERTLPKQLKMLRTTLDKVLADYQVQAGNKLSVEFFDPSADKTLAERIAAEYGFRPMATSMFSQKSFYFYMTLQTSDTIIPLQLPEDLSGERLQEQFTAALQRLAPGFLKTVGLALPQPQAGANPYQRMQGGKRFDLLAQKLSENYAVKPVNLKSGVVDEVIDVLLVLAPEQLGEQAVWAIDQFFMKGGTVLISSSPFAVQQTPYQGLQAKSHTSGLEQWLAHHGLSVEKKMVLDPQNENFPVAVNRQLGGMTVQEIQMINYPYAPDLRQYGLNQEHAITKGLPQLTMQWASPIELDAEKNQDRVSTILLKSSATSWRAAELSVQPDYRRFPSTGFASGDLRSSAILGHMLEGQFDSYFADSDLAFLREHHKDDGHGHAQDPATLISTHLTRSPESARLILLASNEFLADTTLQLSRSGGGDSFMNSLQLIENSIDWAVADRALLDIRSRGHFARTMRPMDDSTRMHWEYGNYVFALLGLACVYIGQRVRRQRRIARSGL